LKIHPKNRMVGGMGTMFFTSGQAARQLAVSQDAIRSLCQTGAISAEMTPGGQWRVPVEEVERLKRDGTPPIARPLPANSVRVPAARGGENHAGLFAEPSESVIGAAESVVILENEVKALELRQKKEERLDWFREREREGDEARASAEQEERARQELKQTQAEHDAWLREWESIGLRCLPWDAPSEIQLETHEAIRKRLASLHLPPTDDVTRRLVQAVVDSAIAGWRRNQQIEQILLEARDEMLPYEARRSFSWDDLTVWQVRAVREAHAAISQVGDIAPLEMRTIAKQAVATVEREFRDKEIRDRIIRSTKLPDELNENGRKQAGDAIAAALAKLPVGTPKDRLEAARDEALGPFHAAIERYREEQAQRDREEQRRRQEANARLAADFRAGLLASYVRDYLRELDERGAIRFKGLTERWEFADKLEKEIRPKLMERLLQDPDTSDTDLRKRIEKLVNSRLGL